MLLELSNHPLHISKGRRLLTCVCWGISKKASLHSRRVSFLRGRWATSTPQGADVPKLLPPHASARNQGHLRPTDHRAHMRFLASKLPQHNRFRLVVKDGEYTCPDGITRRSLRYEEVTSGLSSPCMPHVFDHISRTLCSRRVWNMLS